MEYRNYTVEDFVLDDEFRARVLQPRSESTQLWNKRLYDPLTYNNLHQAKKIIQSSQPIDYNVEAEVIEQGLTQLRKQYQQIHTNQNASNTTFLRVFKIAVVALLFLFIGNLKQIQYTPDQILYTATKKQPKEVILPEGSKVILAEDARITFNKNWRDEGKRIAKLQGKAYFSIKKRHFQGEKVNFIVETPNIRVEVLGTEFNVDTDKNITQVVLNSGKVKLSTLGTNQQITMDPGDVVEYFHNFRKLVLKSNTDHKKYITWIEPIRSKNNSKLATTLKNNLSKQQDKKAAPPTFGTYNTFSLTNAIPNMPVFFRPLLPKSLNNLTYQQQVGNHNSSKVMQHGKENIIASVTEGNENTIHIEQKGANNNIDGANKQNNSFSLPEFGIVQYGNFNQINITQEGLLNNATSHQYGNMNKSGITQLGNDNKIITYQIGNDNKAYIEQIGDNLTSKQLQVGSQNTAEAKFEGNNYRTQSDNAEWSSYQEQIGMNNKSMLQITNTSPNTNAYTIQHGKSNKVNSGLSEDYNYLYVIQAGEGNTASSETYEGDFNEIYIYQTGEQNKVGNGWMPGVTQRGALNNVNIYQQGKENTATTSQKGLNNQLKINQQNNK